MSFSAVVMLIFACVVLYGGLFVTLRKAIKTHKEKNNKK